MSCLMCRLSYTDHVRSCIPKRTQELRPSWALERHNFLTMYPGGLHRVRRVLMATIAFRTRRVTGRIYSARRTQNANEQGANSALKKKICSRQRAIFRTGWKVQRQRHVGWISGENAGTKGFSDSPRINRLDLHASMFKSTLRLFRRNRQHSLHDSKCDLLSHKKKKDNANITLPIHFFCKIIIRAWPWYVGERRGEGQNTILARAIRRMNAQVDWL